MRTLCLAREILAFRDGLADFAFAMQGLGTGSISLFGSEELKARICRRCATARRSRPSRCPSPKPAPTSPPRHDAKPDGAHVRLDGEKTWISNGGIADHYVVFARTGEAPGAAGLSAFVVDADAPGLTVAERIEVIAPHPLARLAFEAAGARANRLGEPGDGFKVAMATLDIFRSTVGAAALGFARRALHETLGTRHPQAVRRAARRLQLTQAAIADSATEVDAAALLVYRAAWTKDRGAARVTREAAMAKMVATEAAQRVIDRAVQLPAASAYKGVKVEELYREIRALRIYEGATEVQKIVIAREMLKQRGREGRRLAAEEEDGDGPMSVMSTPSRATTCRRASNGPSSCSTCRSCAIPSG